MRKQATLYFLLVCSLIVTMLAAACNGQPGPTEPTPKPEPIRTEQTTLPRKPRMWLGMDTCLARIGYYNSAWEDLTETARIPGTGETKYLTYDSLAFANMIAHFKSLDYIWLDVIIANDTTRNKLTLLYRPAADTGKMGYYTLKDTAKDFDPKMDLLKKKDAENMINSYRINTPNSKMRILTEYLDKTDSLNYPKGAPLKYPLLNTIVIRYDSTSIGEMMREIYYQSIENNNRVSGIRAMFAMIGPNGLEKGDFQGRYKNRLVIHFEFMKRGLNGRHKVFFIDTTHNARNRNITFGQRPAPEITKEELDKMPDARTGLDKGQLCPAHCPEVGDDK